MLLWVGDRSFFSGLPPRHQGTEDDKGEKGGEAGARVSPAPLSLPGQLPFL